VVAAMTIALIWVLCWGAARINAAYFPREDQAPLKFQGKRGSSAKRTPAATSSA